MSPTRTRRGYAAKARAATLLAQKHDCAAVVAVLDEDGHPQRIEELREARESARVPLACGMAIPCIESWTLGAPTALSEVLSIEITVVTTHCPPARVEHLNENSEDPARRPKAIVENIARAGGREDGLSLREEVAAVTDVDELRRHCPRGFAPFADDLVETLR